MRAGTLRRQITIQSRSSTPDTFGQSVRTWSNLVTTWADIEPLSGRELEVARAVQPEVTHQVTIRYRTGLTDVMRIVYQGRYFNINSILDVGMRHEILQMLCTEGLDDGS
jgi:SPP1 family predicted phage head-tail adaptor